jgi:hypothetical protein
VIELCSLGQWRVCLDAHTMARAPTSNVIAEKERVHFDLVNSRHHLRQLQNVSAKLSWSQIQLQARKQDLGKAKQTQQTAARQRYSTSGASSDLVCLTE